MCQTWKRTHSLRGVGGPLMELHGKTGVHTAWDHLILSLHPWTTPLPYKFPTAHPSTVTCILQDLRCYSRRRKTLMLHSFLLIEKDAIHSSGWVKLRNHHLQVSNCNIVPHLVYAIVLVFATVTFYSLKFCVSVLFDFSLSFLIHFPIECITLKQKLSISWTKVIIFGRKCQKETVRKNSAEMEGRKAWYFDTCLMLVT